ncbi:uncharacterized protein UTRI_00295_B [Ustilago trichophora]|uniref:AB hydrolase-1 domain-containing protein n=1 Tax=Ustilago trichophora TaxID=86804 RepID=A0A5C3DSE1_9BASI|nr:uncharacterized protein UTRI_00295_B [Ustilago trichophora]
MGSSSARTTSDAIGGPRHGARMMGGGVARTNAGQPGTSYYDLYPERKRTGPYIPKPTLLAHENILPSDSRTPGSKEGTIRRSRSGSQLDSQHESTTYTTDSKHKHSGASLRLPDSIDDAGSRPVRRSVSSTYAASSKALGRARPHAIEPQPVKSIEEIVRAHSSNLLGLAPSQRGPQCSVSWSAFEHTARESQRIVTTHLPQKEEPSDTESDYSDGSIEQEARTILKNAQGDRLDRRLSQLSVGNIDPRTGSVRHDARAKLDGRAVSPNLLSPRQSPVRETYSGSAVLKRGLTRCVQVKVPGAPNLLVSFADVGIERGHPVMVFLGLGASRHLIGLYDDLAVSLGLRLVCIDRWGIGRTDSISTDGRNILGWSFVVEQVADLLGLDKFSILAHSAGAPFAAALALLFPHRVQGPLHLLAPWTGMQQDSGYRWLRYVPDGVIKTAQAAEWRIQNWKLNKEGAKSIHRTALTQANDDLVCGDAHRKPTPPPRQRTPRLGDPTVEQGTRANNGAAIGPFCRSDDCQEAATRDAVDGSRPFLTHEDKNSMLAEAERSSALELLRASHAESARGLVDDLNLVLGKRPWGFGYSDLQVSCEVWHGSKDERIPLSSSVSLSREMRDCSLRIVEGAGHSLMTSTDVVVEVFESIRKHAAL